MDKIAGRRLLFEFKAGKCIRDGKKINPDHRKGQVQIFQTLLDGLTHFGWFERDAVVLEDDLIIFPDDAKWRKLPQGRIFLLEFASAPEKKHFYWLQEASQDKDAEIEATVQKLVSQPPALTGAPGAFNVTATTSTPIPSQPTIAPVKPAPAAVPSSPAPSSSTPSQPTLPTHPAPSAPSSGGVITPEALNAALGLAAPAGGSMNVQNQLQAILSNFLQSPAAAGAAAGGGGGEARQEGPALGTFLSGEQLQAILSRHPEAERRLLEFCPPELQQPGELNQLLRSPQFQQAVDMFNYALATGQIQWSLFSELNIDRNALGQRPSAERFLRAIRPPAEKKEKDTDKKEKMDTN